MLSMKSALALFVGSASVTGLLVSAQNADAISRRQHASACQHVPVATNADFYGGALRATGSGTPYICPALDDSYLKKGSVTTFNVHVLDDNDAGGFSAKLCSINWAGGVGGQCGAPDTTGNAFVGNDTLTPALTYWSPDYVNDFGYLWLEIPGYDSGRNPGYSMFRGSFYSN